MKTVTHRQLLETIADEMERGDESRTENLRNNLAGLWEDDFPDYAFRHVRDFVAGQRGLTVPDMHQGDPMNGLRALGAVIKKYLLPNKQFEWSAGCEAKSNRLVTRLMIQY